METEDLFFRTPAAIKHRENTKLASRLNYVTSLSYIPEVKRSVGGENSFNQSIRVPKGITAGLLQRTS